MLPVLRSSREGVAPAPVGMGWLLTPVLVMSWYASLVARLYFSDILISLCSLLFIVVDPSESKLTHLSGRHRGLTQSRRVTTGGVD